MNNFKRFGAALLLAIVASTAFGQVKNIVAKNWPLVASFDGFMYSNYPTGNKPAGYVTTPTLLNTDIVSGTLTNCENNKGSYLSLFGYQLGTKATLGTSSGARVYLRDPIGDNTWHEVDNYRFLVKSRTFAVNQVEHIRVQVGALGGSQTAGRALDVKINVAGTDTNVLTGQFIIQPGHCYFVALTGSDSTGVRDDITHPYRYIQNWNGSAMVQPSVFAVTGGIQPGDTIVIRGGNWTDVQGYDARWLRFAVGNGGFNLGLGGGNAPTGAASHGYIHITAYPTTTGNEDVHYTSANGGIQGVESSFANAGWGQYVTVSGLRMETSANSLRDAGMVNFQNGANHWRVFDIEAGPWVTTTNVTNSSGIGGEGSNSTVMFNYVHDISGNLTDLQNHGMYFGGYSSGATNVASKNLEIAYNWVVNSSAGSSIQLYWQGAADSNSTFTGTKIHHNYFDGSRKYGINMADGNVSGDIYNNIVLNSGINALRFVGPNALGTFNMNWAYNTIFNWNTTNDTKSAVFETDGYANNGVIALNHNIFASPSGHTQTLSWYSNQGAGDGSLTMSQNLYYDYAGVLTGSAAKDATPITGSPNFTNYSTNDYTVQSGAAVNAATTSDTISVATDFYGITRPQSTHNNIGAAEGIGQ